MQQVVLKVQFSGWTTAAAAVIMSYDGHRRGGGTDTKTSRHTLFAVYIPYDDTEDEAATMMAWQGRSMAR